jgi:hypothetical protein
MRLADLKIRASTEIGDGHFVILELAEPVEMRCSSPDCHTAHRADVLLLDRKMNAIVPMGNVAEAREHVAGLGLA